MVSLNNGWYFDGLDVNFDIDFYVYSFQQRKYLKTFCRHAFWEEKSYELYSSWNILKDFNSGIWLIPDDVSAHEKYSNIVCCPSEPLLDDLREKFQGSMVAKGLLCSTRDCYLGTVSCNVFFPLNEL